MISTNIDLGQVIIGVLITVVGILIKRTVDDFSRKIDKHDEVLSGLLSDVNQLIGYVGMRKGDRGKIE